MTYDKNSTDFQPKPTSHSFKDLEGQIFGRLTVLGFLGIKGTNSMWLCKCECGNISHKVGTTILRGLIVSCGCFQREQSSKRLRTHGMTNTPEFETWHSMLSRCRLPSVPNFHRYGGRGITVCERWQDSFENFYADMGDRPTSKHSIERRDNDGDYTPENCYWGTEEEQQNNKSGTKRVVYQGESLSIAQWSRKLGINRHTLYNRLKSDWPLNKLFLSPRYRRS